MADDEISRATPLPDPSHKRREEQLEQMPSPVVDPNLPFAHARMMDPAHRVRVEKSLKRKLDARCGLFVVIYIMNYLDRNNIAAARLKGLQDDLNLDDAQYSTCLSILYVGYILMQVPSNMYINRISRPSLYLSAVMLLWGLISTLSGVANNFTDMVVIRFFLGFVEVCLAIDPRAVVCSCQSHLEC